MLIWEDLSNTAHNTESPFWSPP